MRHASHAPILEARVRAAWQTQMAAAVHTPGLLPALVQRQSELLPRFATYYTDLWALPRRVRRALQRQWRQPLAEVALLLALGQQPGLAATIPVGDACTLVDALTAANTDTATGGCPAGRGADIIVLPAGSTQTLTAVNNSTYGPTGLPVIRSTITIAGNESTIARASGAPEFRILAVSNTGDLTLQETTVSGGVSSTLVTPYNGGGVANYGGTLTMVNSTISGNAGGEYCGYGAPCSGGGVYSSGTVTMIHSTIAGNANTASGGGGGNGGGVANSGTFTMTHSTITGNHSGYGAGDGGGVANSGTFTMTHSTIADNGIGYAGGGGVANSGTFTMTHSTITGNRIFLGAGGGVANYGGTLTMVNSTISGNDGSNGGGVANFDSGTLTILNSTISGNTARRCPPPFCNTPRSGGGVWNSASGTLTLARTLITGNTASIGPEMTNNGTVVADNYNLFGVNGTAGVEGFSPGATDVVPPAGVLLPDILNPTLANNGGPTQTHALVPRSPAIDAGGPMCTDATGDPLLTDQRGKPRVVDGDGDGTAACDIGAFEFFPLVNALVALEGDVDTDFDPTPVAGGSAGTFTVTATFTNTSDTPLRFPFFTVTDLSGDNLLLNADEGTQGVGATRTLDVGDHVLTPGETVAIDFVIGLQVRERFTFFVDLFGEPLR